MSDPVLAVSRLNAYYGAAHVLQGVQFELEKGAVAIVGRNGMGKSTLCNAITGLHVELLAVTGRVESDADCPARF